MLSSALFFCPLPHSFLLAVAFKRLQGREENATTPLATMSRAFLSARVRVTTPSCVCEEGRRFSITDKHDIAITSRRAVARAIRYNGFRNFSLPRACKISIYSHSVRELGVSPCTKIVLLRETSRFNFFFIFFFFFGGRGFRVFSPFFADERKKRETKFCSVASRASDKHSAYPRRNSQRNQWQEGKKKGEITGIAAAHCQQSVATWNTADLYFRNLVRGMQRRKPLNTIDMKPHHFRPCRRSRHATTIARVCACMYIRVRASCTSRGMQNPALPLAGG